MPADRSHQVAIVLRNPVTLCRATALLLSMPIILSDPGHTWANQICCILQRILNTVERIFRQLVCFDRPQEALRLYEKVNLRWRHTRAFPQMHSGFAHQLVQGIVQRRAYSRKRDVRHACDDARACTCYAVSVDKRSASRLTSLGQAE